MNITLSDLIFLMDQSRRKYLETPSPSRLEGMSGDLSDKELVALSWLNASLNLLAKKEIFRLELDPTMTVMADSDTATDE